MPRTLTRDYGWIEYSGDDVLDFPRGLPGFPACRRFLTLRPEADEPFVVLQSLDEPRVAFLLLPVESLMPDYQPRVLPDDLAVLGGRTGSHCTLTVVSMAAHGEATVNLLGPIVIDTSTRRGVQAIRDDARYGAAVKIDDLLATRPQEVLTCS